MGSSQLGRFAFTTGKKYLLNHELLSSTVNTFRKKFGLVRIIGLTCYLADFFILFEIDICMCSYFSKNKSVKIFLCYYYYYYISNLRIICNIKLELWIKKKKKSN